MSKSMNPIFKVLLCIWALSVSGAGAANAGPSDADICAFIEKLESDFAKKMPMKVDEITTAIAMTVNCQTKVQVWKKQISVTAEDLASGWEERKQRQHSQLHCNRQGLASASGWTVIDNVYDKDFSLIATLKTTPSSCKLRMEN